MSRDLGEFATTVALIGLYGFVAYLIGYYVGIAA